MSEVRRWRKARVMDAPAHRHVRKWLRSGLDDFRANLGISLCYGLGAVIAVWSVLGILILTGLGWLILPLCAGAMMLWPVMTVGLYKIAAGEGEIPRTAAGQLFLGLSHYDVFGFVVDQIGNITFCCLFWFAAI